jgi:hypothetical protein
LKSVVYLYHVASLLQRSVRDWHVDLLSEGQKQLARRCSLLAVECEQIEAKAVVGEEIDLDAYGT